MATTTTLEVFGKKIFIAKSSNLLLGKKWWMKTNIHRGSPNILVSPLSGDERWHVLKIAVKVHYKRRNEFVDNPLNINTDIRYWSLVVKMACCRFLCLHFFMCDTMSANHIGMQIKMWVQQLLSTGANLDMGVTSDKPCSIDKSKEWIFKNSKKLSKINGASCIVILFE